MPRAPRRCPRAGCTELIRGRKYCPAHTETWQGSERGRVTSTYAWRRLRDRILDRDKGVCYLCGRGGADTVDHVTSVARGGTDHPANLAAVHDRTAPHCHRAKTNQERAIR